MSIATGTRWSSRTRSIAVATQVPVVGSGSIAFCSDEAVRTCGNHSVYSACQGRAADRRESRSAGFGRGGRSPARARERPRTGSDGSG